jgi:hypothetical protein
MKHRITAPLLSALAVGALAASASAAGLIGVYRNSMDTAAQRGQLVKLSGRSCKRGGLGGTLKIEVGKRTPACAYRTPVIGRDLEVAATERLLSGTPKELRRKAYLGLQLRAGGGGRYELLVYPVQRKVQLVKVTPEGTEFLEVAKDQKPVQGVDKANVLRLLAVNLKSGPEKGTTRLQGYVGSTLVVHGADPGGGGLKGRYSALVAGAARNARDLIVSADDVVVRVPSPY